MLGEPALRAADKTIARLQAENSRLEQENTVLRKVIDQPRHPERKPAMTNFQRFYFDFVQDGEFDQRDDEGTEFPDLEAAAADAQAALLDIARDCGTYDLACVVRNEAGDTVHIATLKVGGYDLPVFEKLAA